MFASLKCNTPCFQCIFDFKGYFLAMFIYFFRNWVTCPGQRHIGPSWHGKHADRILLYCGWLEALYTYPCCNDCLIVIYLVNLNLPLFRVSSVCFCSPTGSPFFILIGGCFINTQYTFLILTVLLLLFLSTSPLDFAATIG